MRQEKMIQMMKPSRSILFVDRGGLFLLLPVSVTESQSVSSVVARISFSEVLNYILLSILLIIIY